MQNEFTDFKSDVLKETINIRIGTKEDFDINEDDIRVCDAAFDCIMEDINYDCYLEDI